MADDNDNNLLTFTKVIVGAQDFREANEMHGLSAAHCVDGALAALDVKVSDDVHDALCAAVLCDWFTPPMALRELERRVATATKALPPPDEDVQ